MSKEAKVLLFSDFTENLVKVLMKDSKVSKGEAETIVAKSLSIKLQREVR